MKKSIFTLLFAFTTMTAALAQENYQVTLISNHSLSYAKYSIKGKSPEVRRNISPLSLSGTLQKNLKAYYNGHWVIDLVEITKGDAKAYYATLEGPDEKIMLKSVAGGNWEMISVLNKASNSIFNK
jgi:hypothetical protein